MGAEVKCMFNLSHLSRSLKLVFQLIKNNKYERWLKGKYLELSHSDLCTFEKEYPTSWCILNIQR